MRKVKTNLTENCPVQCMLVNNEVFHAYLTPDSVGSKEEVDYIINEYNKQKRNKPLKFLLEMAPYSSLDINGFDVLINSNLDTLCEAFVTNDLAQVLTLNFYYRKKRAAHPTKMFKKRESALEWLKGCV